MAIADHREFPSSVVGPVVMPMMTGVIVMARVWPSFSQILPKSSEGFSYSRRKPSAG